MNPRRSGLVEYSDDAPVVALYLDREGLDFLCSRLPQTDDFTRSMWKLCEQLDAREIAAA